MDIERLKELKSVVEAKSCRIFIDDNGVEFVFEIKDKELMWALEECSELIDEAIARQSVTSEDNWKELREEFMYNLRGCNTVTVSLSGIGSTDYSTEDIHDMIASLTDNQGVVKSATSEEVQEAISHVQGGYGDIWQWPKKRRDTIITALQAYQPWVPVSERIPTESELRNGMVLAWSTELCEWQVENWGYVEDRPEDYTHWKPLPEPPKGE